MSLQIADTVTVVDPAVTNVVPVLGGGELLNMGFGIVVVVAAILLLGWFFSKSRLLRSSGNDIINIVASRALGPKERLMLIEVAEQQLLIGMTASGVQTLHVLEQPIVIAAAPQVLPSFASRLRSSLQEIRK